MMRSHQIVCVIPLLAASLEPLTHRQSVASLNLFFRYYFDRCSSALDKVVPLPHSRGKFIRYSDRLYDFSVTITDVIRISMSTVSFLAPLDPGIWNFLPAECFPLIPMI